VQLTDAVPAGTTLVSAIPPPGWTFTFAGGVVTESTPTLPNGAGASFVIVVHANSSDTPGSTITNTAKVGSSTFDPNSGNNSSTVMTTVTAAQADLSVTKSGPMTVTAGTNLTYTITVKDNGPSDAQGVSLTDMVPSGTTFVSEKQTSGPMFMVSNPPPGSSGGTVSGTISQLSSGASATFVVVVNANASDLSGSTISNTATVSTTTTDPTPGNNSATVTTSVRTSADVRVGITGPQLVMAGALLTYTLTVTNAGPSDAQGVQLTDMVPSGTTFVSAPSGTYNAGNNTVSYTPGTVAAGASVTFTLVVRANASDPNGFTIHNVAQVSSTTFDPLLSNNTFAFNTYVGMIPPM
jgi:uncharacterized repeat protein (TIGR01451 family)